MLVAGFEVDSSKKILYEHEIVIMSTVTIKGIPLFSNRFKNASGLIIGIAALLPYRAIPKIKSLAQSLCVAEVKNAASVTDGKISLSSLDPGAPTSGFASSGWWEMVKWWEKNQPLKVEPMRCCFKKKYQPSHWCCSGWFATFLNLCWSNKSQRPHICLASFYPSLNSYAGYNQASHFLIVRISYVGSLRPKNFGWHPQTPSSPKRGILKAPWIGWMGCAFNRSSHCWVYQQKSEKKIQIVWPVGEKLWNR